MSEKVSLCSASSILCLKMCPKKYYLRYVEGLTAAQLGSIFNIGSGNYSPGFNAGGRINPGGQG